VILLDSASAVGFNQRISKRSGRSNWTRDRFEKEESFGATEIP